MTEAHEICVLVADDNIAVRESLVEFLEDYDLAACGAATTEQALQLIATRKIHVAIVDMRLPLIGGEELILRAHEQDPNLRFLIYTGSADLVLPASLESIGVTSDDIYFKPIRNIEALIADIRLKAVPPA